MTLIEDIQARINQLNEILLAQTRSGGFSPTGDCSFFCGPRPNSQDCGKCRGIQSSRSGFLQERTDLEQQLVELTIPIQDELAAITPTIQKGISLKQLALIGGAIILLS